MNIKEKCNHDWVESRKEYDWVMCGLCKEERKATDLIKDLEHELGGLQAANEAAKGIVSMLEAENERLRKANWKLKTKICSQCSHVDTDAQTKYLEYLKSKDNK